MNKKQLSQLPDLKARKTTVTDQLKNLQATSEGVSAETIKQLETQYKEELEKLEVQIADLIVQVKGEQDRLQDRIKELGKAIAANDKELSEAEVLSKSGALSEDDYRKRVKSINQAKSASQKELAKAKKDTEWLNQCLTSETPLQAGNIGDKARDVGGKAKVFAEELSEKGLPIAKDAISKGSDFVKGQLAALKGSQEEKKSAIIKLACLGIAGVFCLFVFLGITSAVLGGIFGDKSAYKLADKYPDAQKRIKVVQKIDNSDDLALVILFDPVEEIRDLALNQIVDQQIVWNVLKEEVESQKDFIKIMENCDHEALRAYAVQHIFDRERLLDYLQNDPSEDVRMNAVKNVHLSSDLVKICSWFQENNNDSSFFENYEKVAEIAWKELKENPDAYITYLASHEFDGNDSYVFSEWFETVKDNQILASLVTEAKDESVRQKAVAEISDLEILLSIAQNAEELQIRREAFETIDIDKVNDLETLTFIAREGIGRNEAGSLVSVSAIEKIDDQEILRSIIKTADSGSAAQLTAFDRINDPKILTAIAKEVQSRSVRERAFDRIKDPLEIASIAVETEGETQEDAFNYLGFGDTNPKRQLTGRNRLMALVKEGNNQDILTCIALRTRDGDKGRDIVPRIDSQEILGFLAQEARTENVKMKAVELITDKNVLFQVANEYGKRKDLYSETCKAAANKLRGLDEKLFLKFCDEFDLRAK